MIKDILMFLPDNICHGSLNCFLDIYTKGFEKRGIKVHKVNLVTSNEEIGRQMSRVLSDEHIDAALSINSTGLQDLTNGAANLWDSLNIPLFNYIVDHPMEHSDGLKGTCRNYHIICLDRLHADFVRKYYGNIKSVHALPLTGVGDPDEAVDDYESFISRESDVTVTMGLLDVDVLKDQINQLPDGIRTIALDWTDYMEANLDVSPEIALKEILEHNYGNDTVIDELYLAFSEIGLIASPYIRVWVRKRIVEEMIRSGLKFNLYGGGWEKIKTKYPRSGAELCGDIPMTQTPDLFRKTKLTVNVLPMFKQGTHDRIATAQINGAAVITDGNDFLRQLYKPNEIAYFDLDKPEEVPEKIQALLDDPKALYETAIRGQAVARKELSGDAATEKLINIMEEAI